MKKNSFKTYRFAAIDIGSNAARLLISDVLETESKPILKKINLFRVPLRLGFDVFDSGEISDLKILKFVKSMRAFKELMEVYDITDYRACATSAMREAKNSEEIIEEIQSKTGIQIQSISGKEEADIIFNSYFLKPSRTSGSTLFVDVGGGSTELSLFVGNEIQCSKSFKIGTIRLLKNQISKENWKEMKSWIKSNTTNENIRLKVSGIGSGGNINKIFSMHKKGISEYLTFREVLKFSKTINEFTYEERLRVLKLKPDRADVIVPAAKIFAKVMKWSKMKKLFVPEIGLADGIIMDMYNKNHK